VRKGKEVAIGSDMIPGPDLKLWKCLVDTGDRVQRTMMIVASDMKHVVRILAIQGMEVYSIEYVRDPNTGWPVDVLVEGIHDD
jgi:hypothetical protein